MPFDDNLWCTAAQIRGLASLVIDGGVRDSVHRNAIGPPEFAHSLCIRGTGNDVDALGWINAPDLFDDFVVPGDRVESDGDGVVVIPCVWDAEV